MKNIRIRSQKLAFQYRWKRIFGCVLLMTGTFVFVFPCYEQWKINCLEEKMIEDFRQKNNGYDEKTQRNESSSDNETEETNPWKEPTLQKRIVQYNEKLFLNHQEEFSDEDSVKMAPLFLTEYQNCMFGYIEIPRIECKMPLFLGASDQHLDQGAAVLGGTSLPVGGSNTNCVIAGHRGWKQREYLKRIEELSVGDEVFVTNPWECLCYCVADTEIIYPNESEKLKIQKGQDMVTIVTCHPYRSGGKYRYVIYCTRVQSDRKIYREIENVKEDGREELKLYRQEDPGMPEKEQVTSVSDIHRETMLRKAGGYVVIILLGLTVLTKLRNFLQHWKTDGSGQSYMKGRKSEKSKPE